MFCPRHSVTVWPNRCCVRVADARCGRPLRTPVADDPRPGQNAVSQSPDLQSPDLQSPDLLHRPSPSAGQRHCSKTVSRQPDYPNTAAVSAVSPSPVPPVTVWLNRGCVPVTERRIRGDWKMLWPHHSHPPLSRAVSPLRRPITVRLNRGCVPFAAPPSPVPLCGAPALRTPAADARCGRPTSRTKCCVPVITRP